MNIIQSNIKTMSSREIAIMTDKQHSKVMRTIEDLIDKGVAKMATLSSYVNDQNGQSYNEYRLDKRDSLVLVARLSPEFTAVVIDRWQELESAAQQPAVALPDFSNPAASARAWAEQYEISTAAQEQLQIAAPKVAFVDNLVDRGNLMNATQVGSKHGMSAVKLNSILDELGGVYDKRTQRGRVFTAKFISSGYGQNKKTESGYDQPLFTNAGEIWINEQLINEGVV